MPVDPADRLHAMDTSGQEPYNVALSLGVEQPALMRGRTTPCLFLQARVVAGAAAPMTKRQLICAGYGGRDSACISGHALHLVLRLVLEKVPGRLPCPFIMRLGTSEARRNRITNRRLASKVGVGERPPTEACFVRCAAQQRARRCLPSPGVQKTSSISWHKLYRTLPSPFDLPSVRDQ